MDESVKAAPHPTPPVMVWNPASGAPSPRAAAATAVVTCLLVTGIFVAHVGHPSSGEPREPPAGGKAFSAYFRKLTRERRAVLVPTRRSSAPEPVECLSPSDVFIAVKSTQRYHRERLELLLDTWISRSAQQVSLEPIRKNFQTTFFLVTAHKTSNHFKEKHVHFKFFHFFLIICIRFKLLNEFIPLL